MERNSLNIFKSIILVFCFALVSNLGGARLK